MKGKKTLLLAIAAVCLAVPASASATENRWYDHDQGKYSPAPPGKTVTPHTNLTFTVGMTTYGPCKLALHGFVWNPVGGMGEGSLTLKQNSPCPTSTLGCTIETTTINKIGLTLLTNTNIRFSLVGVEWHLSGVCGGATKTVTGTVDGYLIPPVTNEAKEWEGPSTAGFTSAPGLTVAGTPATLDGTIEFGTHFTIKP